MHNDPLLERITSDPPILAGKPVIKGTRISDEIVLGLWGQGATAEEIWGEYDGLGPEDLRACQRFAARAPL